jgi:hypothetical protein
MEGLRGFGIGRTYSAGEICIRGLVRKLEGKSHLEDLGVDKETARDNLD